MGLCREAGHEAPPILRRRAMGSTPYDAAGRGRRGAAWNTSRLGVNTLLFAHGEEIRSRSRDAVRNSAWAAAAIDSYVANAIGRGIRLVSQHKSEKVRIAIAGAWNRWIRQSDVEYEPANLSSGQMDWYGQQVVVAREVLEAGECFIRYRVRPASDGLAVPLQLQLIEAEQLPLWRLSQDGIPKDNVVRSGIEYRPDGRREAYHFWKAHPGETMFFPLEGLQVDRVPAKDVLHVYRPLRAGQMRGQPQLTAVLAKLYELEQYTDAEIVRKKTAAMITGFIKQTSPDQSIMPISQQVPAPNSSTDPATAVSKLEPGTFPILNPGEDVVLAQHRDTSDYPGFIKSCLLAFAAGCGLTYEQISGDLRNVSYSSIRAGILEFRRKAEQFQHSVFVFQFCNPVYRRWLLEAVISGALVLPGYAKDPAQYEDVRWETPGWPWVDPKNDIESSVMAIRGGLTTRTMEASERGVDSAAIDAEIARDNDRADELGLVYDSDPRKVLLMRETNPVNPVQPGVSDEEIRKQQDAAPEGEDAA